MSIQQFKACVFGNPIEQSKSPIIHTMFAKEFGLPLIYQKRLAAESGFVESVNEFFSDPNAIGANVTMPFKHDAAAWVDHLSEQAKRAGAVNTIIRTSNGFIGDNSDGVGLVNDLLNHNVHLQGARVLLIGAGGAAKGALPALLDAGVGSVLIYNRSEEKALELAEYTKAYAQVDVQALLKLNNTIRSSTYDLIINATSLSLLQQLPDLPDSIFFGGPAVYDMVYQNEPTVFLKKAVAHNCPITIDGLGMLVEQAAHSFYLWFDKKPRTQAVYEYLRALAKQA